jgi:hypothetical protein
MNEEKKEFSTIKGMENPQDIKDEQNAYKPQFNNTDALSGFDDLDAREFLPEGIEDHSEEKEQAQEKALASKSDLMTKNIRQALDYYEAAIGFGGHKRFALDDETKDHSAEQLTPLALKYLPEDFDLNLLIFGKYGPEIMGIFAIYTLGKATVVSVKQLKQEDKNAIDDKREQDTKKAQARKQAQASQDSQDSQEVTNREPD